MSNETRRTGNVMILDKQRWKITVIFNVREKEEEEEKHFQRNMKNWKCEDVGQTITVQKILDLVICTREEGERRKISPKKREELEMRRK